MSDKRDLPTTKTGGKEVRQKVDRPKEIIKEEDSEANRKPAGQFQAPGHDVRK